VQRLERLSFHRGNPARGVPGDARTLDHLVGAPALTRGDVGGSRRVDDARKRGRDDEHRPAHPQDLDQGAVVVQRTLDVLVREVPRARTELHVHRRGVRRVDAGHGICERPKLALQALRGQRVTHADPPPAFGRVDPVHAGRG
jgi:hypothetical protein